jgi:hypothetical protein
MAKPEVGRQTFAARRLHTRALKVAAYSSSKSLYTSVHLVFDSTNIAREVGAPALASCAYGTTG